MTGRSFFEGAGIAILVLAYYLLPILSPYHVATYHNPSFVSAAAGGAAIDLIVVMFICVAVIGALGRIGAQKARFVWVLILAFTAVRLWDLAVTLLNFYKVSIRWPQSLRTAIFCGILGIALTAWRFFPRRFEAGIRLGRMGLAIFGCCILWMLPILVAAAVMAHKDGAEAHAFHRSVPPPSASQERVIWVLMDELSYDQVYQDRQPGLKLPVFDELKNESVVFSNVQPEGYFTQQILPALLLDRSLDNIRSSMRGDLYVHEMDPSQWEPFREQETIFAKAKRLGWTTGVAGWYNPYCHILRNVLNSCYWELRGSPLPPAPGPPTVRAAAIPLYMFLSKLGMLHPYGNTSVQNHIEDYEGLMVASRSAIQDESIDFVFLHLPIPHPPAIYDRKTGQLKPGGSYLDNVALSDKTMGELLSIIQKTKAADRTTLIVSSDHSWRVPMWRTSGGWTPEDERASRGKFDQRPFLLVHLPDEGHGEMWNGRFPELETDTILLKILSGEIHSQGDLDNWLQRNENQLAAGS